MTQCKRCGYLLQPGAFFCPSCGTAISNPADNKPAQPFQAFDAPTLGDGPYLETAPAAREHVARPSQGDSDESGTTQITDYGLHALQKPAQPPQMSFSDMQSAQSPAYFPTQPPEIPLMNSEPPAAPHAVSMPERPVYAPYPQQPVSSRPPQNQHRSRLSRSATITYMLLALVAMLSGLLLILYSAILHPAQLHQQATATAVAQMNLQVSQTALANAQGSATAIAMANATATAQALATAQAVATTTALQNIYTQGTSGTPALNDPLSGYNGYNWDIGVISGGGGCNFSGGAYHVSIQTKGYFLPCLGQSTSFSNFAYQVTMSFVRGDSGGIVFRANSTSANGYLFGITLSGAYSIVPIKNNSANNPISSDTNSAINTSQHASNLLTVIARGNNLFLYINKHFVVNVTDNTFSSGQIGMFASDDSGPTDVAFTKAEVWRL